MEQLTTLTRTVQRALNLLLLLLEPCSAAATNSTTSAPSRARVRVEGARRIWGTHPHATTRTVENAIERFCNVQGLRIKRKTSRSVQSRKSSWWFVVHADEPVLRELDEKWESLSTQTSWILKPCSKPAEIVDHASNSAETSTSLPSKENPTLDTQRAPPTVSVTPTSGSEQSHLPSLDGRLSHIVNHSDVKEKPSQQGNPVTGNN